MMRAALLLVLLAGTFPADASQLCATRTGTLKLRETCKPRETPVGTDASLQPSLVVVDANGVVVGVVVAMGPPPVTASATVVRRLSGIPVQFPVNRDGFPNSVGTLPPHNFETDDCSGPPFVRASPAALGADAHVVGGIASFPSVPGTPRTWRSTLLRNATQQECDFSSGTFTPPASCCTTQNLPADTTGSAVLTFDLSTLGLVPPFRVVGP